MNSVVKLEHKDVDAIPFQEASLDIWDKKYRLSAKDGTPVDKTMDDTYKRVARALADVEHEPVREQWYERFVWALRRGAIPAGRVTSNAGALEHKPATSTINCTVSGTIGDSMDDILNKVHEAGLTLKAGCGIGYEFSTLRPRGAYVSGAGAYTCGPLSFMDIYDKMCFTVSSAGGRRGAQMGTFDVGHPDAMEFIRAKRENGRLRQFNLSLLVTDEFMHAVRAGQGLESGLPAAHERVRPGRAQARRHHQVRVARVADHQRLRDARRRPGLLQDLQDAAGAPHVGRHHDVHLRLRRAGLHPHRSRQRDEQQLVVRKHSRHQSLRHRGYLGADERGTAPGRRAHRQAVRGARRRRRSRQQRGRLLPHGAQAAGEAHDRRRPFAAAHFRSPRAPHLDADAFPPGHRVVRRRRPRRGRQSAAAGSSARRDVGRHPGFKLWRQRGLPHGPAGRRRHDHRRPRGAVDLGAPGRGQQRHRRRRSAFGHGRGARCRALLQPSRRFLRLAPGRGPRRVPSRHGRHHRAGARPRTASGPPDRHARPSSVRRASSIVDSCAACSTPMAACRAIN